jgi:hypothetical protein
MAQLWLQTDEGGSTQRRSEGAFSAGKDVEGGMLCKDCRPPLERVRWHYAV